MHDVVATARGLLHDIHQVFAIALELFGNLRPWLLNCQKYADGMNTLSRAEVFEIRESEDLICYKERCGFGIAQNAHRLSQIEREFLEVFAQVSIRRDEVAPFHLDYCRQIRAQQRRQIGLKGCARADDSLA